MKRIIYWVKNIAETLLRLLPFAARTGLIRVGSPGRDSPVLVTGNFDLTVERVKKALEGLDLYLLVANSRGINVWCASAGGLFTEHDVISVIKTSGIEGLVNHRRLILPQLSATGIRREIIKEKTGWSPLFGPVYAKDLREYIERNFHKSEEMRTVRFDFLQRFEMAVAWAFPISLIPAIPLLIFWEDLVIPFCLLIWGFSLALFLSFPLYSRFIDPGRERKGFIFFDFGRGGYRLIFWALALLALSIYGIYADIFSWGFLLRWGIICLFVVLILSLDLTGSTPVFKSGLHPDRLLKVTLAEDLCKGISLCREVCPRNCYDIDKERHKARMPRAELCVQCGACIVQCPRDALYFAAPDGSTIPPETIRKYKLNLLGTRKLPADERK